MKLIANRFSSYEFTDSERFSASIFSSLQIAWIQNQISRYAEEKNALVIDTTKLQESLQQEAELQGNIRALQRLLDESEAAQSEQSQLETQLAAQSKE